MNNVSSSDKRMSGCCPDASTTTSCQPSDIDKGSCCYPEGGSWGKSKKLVSVLIILAAIGVGANSFIRGTSAQCDKPDPVHSFSASAGLREKPAVPAENIAKLKPPATQEEMPSTRALDSLQTLDRLAADKDVAFILLPGEGQELPYAFLEQVETLVNRLSELGQNAGIFTLDSSAADYSHLVKRFSIKAFPCVVVLGRHGKPSALSGSVSTKQLYGAFISASKPEPCCGSKKEPCCPK